MRTRNQMTFSRWFEPTVTTIGAMGLITLLSGCSGGAKNGVDTAAATESVTQSYGSFTTRAVGTAQPPVISASKGATVYGIAGAAFTDITQNMTNPNVYVAPASNKIAFIRSGEIVVANADGSNTRTLTATKDPANYPVFSPDATKIAFAYENGVTVMNVDGTNVVRFLENASQPCYSPDGKKMVFTRKATNGYWNIFTVNTDGTNVVQLTNVNGNYSGPRYSPDGTKIIFGYASEVYIMAADGTGIKALTDTTTYGFNPTWSPDGKQIAFVGSNHDLWTMNADGTTKVRVTTNVYVDNAATPSYSTDGKRLYFAEALNSQWDVGYVATSGGTVTNITTSSSQDDTAPVVSPVATGTTVPPPPTTKLIGTNGVMGTGCAGFLFGQLDKTVTSVVTFDTALVTVAGRGASRVAALSAAETESQNLIFTLTDSDGNNFSTLKYTNGASPVASITMNQNGAVITFSANDGTVTTVLPYAATKAVGSGQLQTERSGDIVTIRGHFPGVWNGKGENIAANGASVVKINARTGALVSFE